MQNLQFLTPDLPEIHSLTPTAQPLPEQHAVTAIKQPLSSSLPNVPSPSALRPNAPAFTPSVPFSPFPTTNNSPNLSRSLSSVNTVGTLLSQPAPSLLSSLPQNPTPLPFAGLAAPNLTPNSYPQSLYSSFPFNPTPPAFNPLLLQQQSMMQSPFPFINPNFPPYLNFNSFAPK